MILCDACAPGAINTNLVNPRPEDDETPYHPGQCEICSSSGKQVTYYEKRARVVASSTNGNGNGHSAPTVNRLPEISEPRLDGRGGRKTALPEQPKAAAAEIGSCIVSLKWPGQQPQAKWGNFSWMPEIGKLVWRGEIAETVGKLMELVNEANEFVRTIGNNFAWVEVLPVPDSVPASLEDGVKVDNLLQQIKTLQEALVRSEATIDRLVNGEPEEVGIKKDELRSEDSEKQSPQNDHEHSFESDEGPCLICGKTVHQVISDSAKTTADTRAEMWKAAEDSVGQLPIQTPTKTLSEKIASLPRKRNPGRKARAAHKKTEPATTASAPPTAPAEVASATTS